MPLSSYRKTVNSLQAAIADRIIRGKNLSPKDIKCLTDSFCDLETSLLSHRKVTKEEKWKPKERAVEALSRVDPIEPEVDLSLLGGPQVALPPGLAKSGEPASDAGADRTPDAGPTTP